MLPVAACLVGTLLASVPAGATPAESATQQAKPNPARAIPEGLAWLARHQNPDGSWGGNSLMQRCTGTKPCYDTTGDLSNHFDEGLTGLAVLCFLRAGFDPDSKKEIVDPLTSKHCVAGEIVTRGLAWLKKLQKKNGSFSKTRSFIYDDALGTLAMVEAYALTKNDSWKASAQLGVDFLGKAQRPNPSGQGLWGWSYASREESPKDKLSESDTSATNWAIAALHAGLTAGLDAKEASFEGALAFLNFVTVTNGLVGYQSSDQIGLKVTGPFDQYDYHVGTMCALGILIRTEVQRERSLPFYDLAAQKILKDLPAVSENRLSIDYYYWYHGTLALNRLEGTEGPKKAKRKIADPWNRAVTAALLGLQDHTKDACSQGGWVTPDRWNLFAGGPTYSTAMGVLTLEACGKK